MKGEGIWRIERLRFQTKYQQKAFDFTPKRSPCQGNGQISSNEGKKEKDGTRTKGKGGEAFRNWEEI